MIRDLHAYGPRTAPPDARSLAFARELVAPERSAESRTRSGGTLTIAVTAARALTCKRGLAAHLAVQLVGMVGEGERVCIVDADLESRDVGARFGVTGPVLFDVARGRVPSSATALEDVITRVDPPGLYVLPTRLPESALIPMLRAKTAALMQPLSNAFDAVVIDAPMSMGVVTPHEDRALLEQIDVLVVAVAADPGAVGASIRYMNTLLAARTSGALPPNFDVQIVLTGSDTDGSRSLFDEIGLERKLQGLPVAGSVPQLWGRQRPDRPWIDDINGATQDALRKVIDRITAVPAPDRRF